MKSFRRRKRTAISEILGAVILLFITVGAFAVITSGIFTSTQSQQTSIIQAYREGEIKSGQLVSLIYHWESNTGDTVKVGLYNFGYYNVTIEMVFVNGTQESSWALTSASTGNPVRCIPSNNGYDECITPKQVDVLTISGLGGSAQGAVKRGNYELFIYSTNNLAYVWEL
ncbi:MAG: hypothetical protein JRN20_16230 [Nitrososphaerota archaeon]|nr:hypothetical protein [Nitrososphaerota archaeon]